MYDNGRREQNRDIFSVVKMVLPSQCSQNEISPTDCSTRTNKKMKLSNRSIALPVALATTLLLNLTELSTSSMDVRLRGSQPIKKKNDNRDDLHGACPSSTCWSSEHLQCVPCAPARGEDIACCGVALCCFQAIAVNRRCVYQDVLLAQEDGWDR